MLHRPPVRVTGSSPLYQTTPDRDHWSGSGSLSQSAPHLGYRWLEAALHALSALCPV